MNILLIIQYKIIALLSRLLPANNRLVRYKKILWHGKLAYQQQHFFKCHNVQTVSTVFREEVKNENKKNMSVIDFGGGDGSNFNQIFKGIDSFPEKYTLIDIIKKPNVQNLIIADACKPINFDDLFDLAFTNNALEHMSEPFMVADNMYKSLRKGGLVLASTVFSCHHHASPDDYWRFTDSGLKYLFERSGFKTVQYGYDISQRRKEKLGGHLPGSRPLIDSHGGWTERWFVFYVGRKE